METSSSHYFSFRRPTSGSWNWIGLDWFYYSYSSTRLIGTNEPVDVRTYIHTSNLLESSQFQTDAKSSLSSCFALNSIGLDFDRIRKNISSCCWLNQIESKIESSIDSGAGDWTTSNERTIRNGEFNYNVEYDFSHYKHYGTATTTAYEIINKNNNERWWWRYYYNK